MRIQKPERGKPISALTKIPRRESRVGDWPREEQEVTQEAILWVRKFRSL